MAEIRAPASYELVVDQIRRAIQIGRFLAGERLPSERELAEQLGRLPHDGARGDEGAPGRADDRDSARARSGGPVVLGPTASPGESRRVLRRRLAELENVFDYRLAVEPAAARAGGRGGARATILRHLKDALEALNTLAASPDDASEVSPPSRFFATDAEFHDRIALTTRNPLLVQAVGDARAAMFLPVGGVSSPRSTRVPTAVPRGDPRGDRRARRRRRTRCRWTSTSSMDLRRPPSWSWRVPRARRKQRRVDPG